MKWKIEPYDINNEIQTSKWNKSYLYHLSAPAVDQPGFLLPFFNKYKIDTIYLLIGEKENETVCVLPLVINIRQRFFLKWRELGFLYHSHIWLHALPGVEFPSLTEEWDKIIRASEVIPAKWSKFVLRNAQVANTPLSHSDNQVSIFDTQSHKELTDIISKKLIKNLFRLRKKHYPDIGDCLITTYTESTIYEGFEKFITAETSGWKGKSDSVINTHSVIQEIYKETFGSTYNTFNAVIYIYGTGDCDIAGAFGYKSGNCLYLHSINFDSKYSYLSPGSQLMHDILELANLDPTIDEVNLVTDPEWAKRWHPHKRALVNLSTYKRSIKGFFLAIAIKTFNYIKKSYKKYK